MEAILGEKVFKKDGTEVAVSSLADKEVIGIYFSAHWCPPCRGFTPVLSETYKKIQAAGFEVVFVSSDKDEGSFKDYYNSMADWLTIGFDQAKKAAVSAKYGVQGIPMLVLVNAKTGELITKDGRSKVQSDPEGSGFPWTA